MAYKATPAPEAPPPIDSCYLNAVVYPYQLLQDQITFNQHRQRMTNLIFSSFKFIERKIWT